jgi:hypothetical protein
MTSNGNRNYNVLIIRPAKCARRIFRIAAANLLDANELAAEAVATLPPESIEAMSVDAGDYGAHVDPVVIVDVYEDCFELLCVVWAGEQLRAIERREVFSEADTIYTTQGDSHEVDQPES